MFITEFNGKQYVFEDDRLSINGIPILYSDISNIAHRGGSQPAFVFDYKGRRYLLPYNPAELKSILPYFKRAKDLNAAPAPAPVEYEEAPTPAPVVYEEAPAPAPYEYEEAPAPIEYEEATTPYEYEETPEPAPIVYEEAPAPYEYEEATEPAPIEYEEVPAPAPYEYEEAPEPVEYEEVTAPIEYEEVPAPAPYEYEEAPEPAPIEYEEVTEPIEYEEVTEPAPAEYEEATAPIEYEEATAPIKELQPEEPPKKKLSADKIIIGVLILAAIVVAAIFIFGGKTDDSAQDYMSDEDIAVEEDKDADYDDWEGEDLEDTVPTGGTFEATDGFSVTDSDGSMDIKLKKAYTGDAAVQKYLDLGEDADNLTDAEEPGYRLVLYEYEVQVTDGAMIGDTVTGEMYQSDQKTYFDDWVPIDLLKNADKDLSSGEIDIPAGETATIYIAYAMPENLKDYYEKVLVDEDDTEIWVHYVLED